MPLRLNWRMSSRSLAPLSKMAFKLEATRYFFGLALAWEYSFHILTSEGDVDIFSCKCRFKVSVTGLLNLKRLLLFRVL
jgi:hypothetical protein